MSEKTLTNLLKNADENLSDIHACLSTVMQFKKKSGIDNETPIIEYKGTCFLTVGDLITALQSAEEMSEMCVVLAEEKSEYYAWGNFCN